MTGMVTQMISTNYFILVASPPWELRALVLKRRYSHMTALDEGIRGLAGGSRRSRNRRGGCVELVAVSADQRGRRTSRRGGGLPKLGGMEEPPRCPLTYRMIQVLTGHGMFSEYLMKIGRETMDICHHSGGGQGHGAAHAEVNQYSDSPDGVEAVGTVGAVGTAGSVGILRDVGTVRAMGTLGTLGTVRAV
ncbi:uncharacterized protein LOC126925068 [Bombus affinis]|uniref:uncharacterized protein LOC126925068 n=1 Tax=Bombus affinis TaxID=309941 RepID=UPI0021B7FAB3|nr:uncharacterized protein LOC126925068 [Bombus affinis]